MVLAGLTDLLLKSGAWPGLRVTTWWCEVFGGPAGYTERLGGYPAMQPSASGS
jgi:hypothetical protein